jgi:hypothetical protein
MTTRRLALRRVTPGERYASDAAAIELTIVTVRA